MTLGIVFIFLKGPISASRLYFFYMFDLMLLISMLCLLNWLIARINGLKVSFY